MCKFWLVTYTGSHEHVATAEQHNAMIYVELSQRVTGMVTFRLNLMIPLIR